jgi:hypothetical protein
MTTHVSGKPGGVRTSVILRCRTPLHGAPHVADDEQDADECHSPARGASRSIARFLEDPLQLRRPDVLWEGVTVSGSLRRGQIAGGPIGGSDHLREPLAVSPDSVQVRDGWRPVRRVHPERETLITFPERQRPLLRPGCPLQDTRVTSASLIYVGWSLIYVAGSVIYVRLSRISTRRAQFSCSGVHFRGHERRDSRGDNVIHVVMSVNYARGA